jgi:hypothetical protein
MDKPKLKLIQRDNHIFIRVECCLQHAWITTSMQIHIYHNCAKVQLNNGSVNEFEMQPSEAEVFAGHLRFLSAIAEAINTHVADKNVTNIKNIFTTEIDAEINTQVKPCQETSVLH